MKTLKGFADEHGVHAIVRRHFRYAVPAGVEEMLGGYPGRGALTYARIIERNLLPLTCASCEQAREQGRWLAQAGIVPERIVSGIDQRNIDGARWSAYGVGLETGEEPVFHQNPAVTHPYYGDPREIKALIEQHMDSVVHRWLRGEKGFERFCTEDRHTFKGRILSSIMADQDGSVLWDLNFEAIVLLHYLLVVGIDLDEIPIEGDKYWEPKYGWGIAVSADRQWAVEFGEDLNLVGEPRQICL